MTLEALDLRYLHSYQTLWVGLSGGLDSCVLVKRLLEGGFSPRLIHIHHGLSPNADAWVASVETFANDWKLRLSVVRLRAKPGPGESIEAWARQERYQAFEAFIQPNDALLLAHHAEDQAETFLLQALRGAGPKGLASMPFKQSFSQGALIRPLLSVSRESIEDYAKTLDLNWIEDESNQSLRFKRNVLRHEIMPLLKAHFPAYLETLARSARCCFAEHEALDALLSETLKTLAFFDEKGAVLLIREEGFRRLSFGLRRQLLRFWVLTFAKQSIREQQLIELEKLLSAEHYHESLLTLPMGKNRLSFFRDREKLYCRWEGA